MKILESFDTKLDIEELNEAYKKYWEWNVLLIKRHWIKLLLPLALTIVSIFMLLLMLYSIYIHTFDDHKITFWILSILYTYTTISWCTFVIISIIIKINYWTKSKIQYIENPESILDAKKKWFDKFMKRTFLTFWIHVIVFIFNASFPFIFIKTTWLWSIMVAIWILFINFIQCFFTRITFPSQYFLTASSSSSASVFVSKDDRIFINLFIIINKSYQTW